MVINEHQIRISGLTNIDFDLTNGQDVDLIIRGAVYKVVDKDNQDGSFNREYVIKPVEIEEVEDGEDHR